MKPYERKLHWDKIYLTKKPDEVSWYEPRPETSLYFLNKLKIPREASIIDIGGGESYFTDNLLENGYQNLTVLDVSGAALKNTINRIGERAEKINWIENDITLFEPFKFYDFWHDRALFHFLLDEDEIKNYIFKLNKSLKMGGIAVIGTFSTEGPLKCSGLD